MNHKSNSATCTTPRLQGLDLARFAAFVGMVIVNFNVVTGAENTNDLLATVISTLEGKAAATFVVLAGIGLGLSFSHSNQSNAISIILKRAAFLMALGLTNSIIFPADILHYYAVYFALGVFFMQASNRWLVTAIVLLNVIFVVMVIALDYDAGWQWEDYSYTDFWSVTGFFRNLFFNGWHPVAPWLGFLLFGFILSRATLGEARTRHKLILFGVVSLAIACFLKIVLSFWFNSIDPELVILATTSPIPPMPLYFLAGIGAASLTTGICLWLATTSYGNRAIQIVSPAGRQTLTLYIAHIIIGMGTLEALGMIGGQDSKTAILAAILFCGVAVIYSITWSKFFHRGPVEALMSMVIR